MTNKEYIINSDLYDAVLFDLDGVVTRTAKTHAKAWKKLFDKYLGEKSDTGYFRPFDLKDDYIKYVDGKPRDDGVQAFFSSRNIVVPYGTALDAYEKKTICGLGNKKNQLFLDLLKKDGVEVYESTIAFIRELREKGFKTAIVSSSKNCHQVIKTADIEFLFDTRVDGVISENLGLMGKPEPDIFIEAARRLSADVNRCVVVEDALSGVEAGKKGGFGLVIGVDRADHAKSQKQKGADFVVKDFSNIRAGMTIRNLPLAMTSIDKIIMLSDDREIVIIIDDEIFPLDHSCSAENTLFYKDMKKILTLLSKQHTVIITSQGRLAQVMESINIDSVYYADRNDCVIKGPNGFSAVCNDHKSDRGLNKFKFMGWVLKKLNCVSQSIFPIYIGESLICENTVVTDTNNEIVVVVDHGFHDSNASFRVNSLKQFGQFIRKLSSGLDKSTSWGQVYTGFDPEDEGRREALCALGNGYFITRGAAPESIAAQVHYPGTYLAGVYNRLKTKVAEKIVENEDLVNIPNWLCLNFRIQGEDWFQLKDVKILFYRQHLQMKKGILNRTIHFRDKKNRETTLLQHSFVHGDQMHRAALKTVITPLNWDGKIEICSALDGRVTNQGVERYQDLSSKHLDLVDFEHINDESMILKMRTNSSCIEIAMGARTKVFIKNKAANINSIPYDKPNGYIAKHFIVNLGKGDNLTIEKLINIYTSRDSGIYECYLEAKNSVENDIENFDSLLKSHVIAWELLWREFDFKLELDNKDIEQHTQKTIRLYIFHLLQSSSVHSLDIDVGMPARGWHGEGYRGHIFWDEMIIFPFLNYRAPRIIKTLLMYRYRRLKEARRAAMKAGYKGAMYPWQSGSSGSEETQKIHLNPESGRWLPDNTYLQRHVNNAIVYNIWQYFQITHDIQFLSFYGGEIIVEIARFWASIATYNSELDRYEIMGVMGPDEYHDAYPGADKPGLNNNSYTNLMVMFVMDQALNLQHLLPKQDWESLQKRLEIEDKELVIWKKMSRRMKIVFHKDGIISQFEGYEDLKEFDCDHYYKKYGDIQRLDRILEKEGDTTNNYKICKQPDVLMLFYLFSAETLKRLFKRLNYSLDKDYIRKNINYYLNRTTNGSSMALVIHAWIEARQARSYSWELFSEALETDMIDNRTRNIREGIHLAAMSGCIDILQRGYAGLEIRSDILILNPLLPKSIKCICFHIRYRKHWLDLEITQKVVKVKSLTNRASPFTMMVKGEIIKLHPGNIAIVDI